MVTAVYFHTLLTIRHTIRRYEVLIANSVLT